MLSRTLIGSTDRPLLSFIEPPAHWTAGAHACSQQSTDFTMCHAVQLVTKIGNLGREMPSSLHDPAADGGPATRAGRLSHDRCRK